jgi:DNA-binding response OmpR family regulator
VKVLVVDDCHVQGEAIRQYLRDKAFDAEWSSNAADAWRALKAFRPDVMLLDLLLPDMSGSQLYAKMRSEERWKERPAVAVLSGAADAIPEGTFPDTVPVLMKPVPMEMLLATVNALGVPDTTVGK